MGNVVSIHKKRAEKNKVGINKTVRSMRQKLNAHILELAEKILEKYPLTRFYPNEISEYCYRVLIKHIENFIEENEGCGITYELVACEIRPSCLYTSRIWRKTVLLVIIRYDKNLYDFVDFSGPVEWKSVDNTIPPLFLADKPPSYLIPDESNPVIQAYKKNFFYGIFKEFFTYTIGGMISDYIRELMIVNGAEQCSDRWGIFFRSSKLKDFEKYRK